MKRSLETLLQNKPRTLKPMQAAITHPDFLPMFESVNRDLWPLQVLTLLLGIAMAIAALRKSRIADRLSAAVLGSIWIFDGAVFHWVYFRPVYEPAERFAVLWIAQGVLFIVFGVFRPRLSFTAARDGFAAFGFLLIAYALLVYPVLGYLLRSDFMFATWFGPFPCPVAVFTIGMFLLTDARVPKVLVIVPLLWAVTAWVPVSWGVTEDIGLLVGGTIGMVLLFVRDYRNRKATTATLP
jgi:hypothetical protein